MTRLFVSFSGGRTSAYMTWRLLRERGADTDIRVLFANSGEEHEETLRFVKRCDEILGFNTTWVEAVVDPLHGKGTGHRVVSFDTATRPNSKDGPFEQVISKYGIPNTSFPHCTREVKLNPMTSFLRSAGWKAGSYETAVGIRADEMDRVSLSAKARRITYPLVQWNIRKSDVIDFWKSQSFDLYLPEHMGNCVWCWKKTLRKHMTLAHDEPWVFDFPRRMERDYADAGAGSGERRFFRKGMAVEDIFSLSRDASFTKFVDPNVAFDPKLDVGGGCGDSCEIFSDYDTWDEFDLFDLATWMVAA